MKVGFIDYLNCYPFYYHMFEKEMIEGVELFGDYPGGLNSKMISGELDLSPVSSGAFPDMQENCSMLADYCLSSVGYVKSVVLQSHIPIEELDGKTVGLTSASKTSAVLLKILLEKYYMVRPRYVTVNPNPSMDDIDAALVIGNEAMLEEKVPVSYSYDIGDLWLRKTGRPVVFAVFAVKNSIVSENNGLLKKLYISYKKSLAELKENEQLVIEKAREKYPEIKYDIRHYYDLLKFEFTDQLKEALRFYYDEAYSLGLIKKVEKINFVSL